MLKIKEKISNIINKDEKTEDIKNLEKQILMLSENLLNANVNLDFARKTINEKDIEIKELKKNLNEKKDEVEVLKGTIKKLLDDKYGRSSEKNRYLEEQFQKDKEYEKKVNDIKKSKNIRNKKRKKGGQKGHKGSGRKIPKNMKTYTYIWKLPDNEAYCPICNKKYKIKNFQKESYEVEVNIKVTLNHHKREVYEKSCGCNIPQMVVAKKPESIIYKSIFTTGTWCRYLAMKYLSGIPVNRFNELINSDEYKIKQSTIIGGFKKLLEFMKPLYKEIIKYNQREEHHWHADETRWCKMVDPDDNGRKLYWIWLFLGKKSVVYKLDATRSSIVPEKHFTNTIDGVLNVDRLASYNIVADKMSLAYCWYHLRRDFIDAGKKYSELKKWSIDWLLKIKKIENINRERLRAYLENLNIDKIQKKLEKKVNNFFDIAEKNLKYESLNTYQIKILKNMLKKRKGYCTFIDYPLVPLHNNAAEREFRHIAYARNNYNGSTSHWGGELAVVTWSIFKTARLNNLNPIEYLKKYFESYISSNAFKNGIPNELLPWNYIIDTQSNDVNSS